MAVLILNSYPSKIAPYHRWLSTIREELVLFTNLEYNSQSQIELDKDNYKEVVAFKNYIENGNVERMAYEFHKKFTFSRILALSEFDVIRSARLREKLDIQTGQSLNAAICFRDKYIMKERIREKGIAAPAFAPVSNPFDLVKFAQNGYPFILKPRYGSGSVGFQKVHSETELEVLLEKLFSGAEDHNPLLIAESLVEGEMYHIDGVVVQDEVKCIYSSKYINSCISFYEGTFLGSIVISEEDPAYQKTIKLTRDIIAAMPGKGNFAFHCEIFHTPSDEYIFCEIACRAGGGPILNTLQKAFGVSLNEISLKAQCGIYDFPKIDRPTSNEKYAWLIIPQKEGRLSIIPETTPFDWVEEYNVMAQKGKKYESAKHSVDAAATIILRGKDVGEIEKRISQLMDWFQTEWKWNDLSDLKEK